MSNNKINYIKGGNEVRKAWFIYKASKPGEIRRLIDFVAGWNAAQRFILEGENDE